MNKPDKRHSLDVLIVDDEASLRTLLGEELAAMGHATTTAATAGEAFAAIERATFDAVILDLNLPDQHGMEVFRRLRESRGGGVAEVIVLTGHGTTDSAIQAIRLEAFDYLLKPCSLRELDVLLREIARKAAGRSTPPPGRADTARLCGDHPALARVRELIARVAPTDATVLVTGPTGTGKELVAELIHANSQRADGPMVPVNAAALPASLAESELFGHVKGAFTGADRDHAGLIAAADGGTLFLDEIGDLPAELQAKLLRFLERGEVRSVGATDMRQVDVRVVAATNRDLQSAVRDGTFREDLFYRLNEIHIETVPLCAMPGQIAPLAGHFLAATRQGDGIGPDRFSPEALAAMTRYAWPGNVRELINAVQRARLLAGGDAIATGDLPEQVRHGRRGGSAAGGPSLADVEREHILRVLAASDGNKSAAARQLGIGLRTLYNKLAEYDNQTD